MSIKKGGFNNGEYTATYSGMRGVDFDASTEKGRTRFAYLENMYRDYDKEQCRIESIPGFRKLMTLNGRINAIDANLIRKFCANIITKFPVEG